MTEAMRILIVEDLPTDAGLCEREVRQVLPQSEFRRVETREDFLAALATFQPDLILSDYSMPRFDGMEALKLALAHVPETPFLIQTGSMNEETAVACMKAGAWDYVIKEHIRRLGPAVLAALEQKKVRRERRMAEEALFKSEKLYGSLFEGMLNCFAYCRMLFEDGKPHDFIFLTVNDAFESQTGLKDVVGKKVTEVIPGIREADPQLIEIYGRVVMTGRPERFEIFVKALQMWFSISVYRPAPEHFVAVFDVVTERKNAEAEKSILEAKFQQAQKLEAVGMLTGGIAHDFNNLLTTIIGNAELAIGEVGKDSPLHEFLEDIKGAGERAAALTRQLLAFSRKQILQPEPANLNKVMGNMDRMLRRVIRENIEIKTILSPDLGQVYVDVGQMEQVIMNLAVNARDVMPDGGKLIFETSNAELDETYARTHIGVTPGPYVMLAVTDTGIGMTKEVQARIFEPFFTTKEKGKGTGLGLSTAYGIIKQSKGNIWVYSEPGKGSTFEIYLPRMEEMARIVEEPEEAAESLQGSETILLVEDEKLVRNIALKTLRNLGYTVLCAGDGEEALHLCRQHQEPVQLMLTDVVMPGISGKELATVMEKQRPEMKVLFMSGYTDNAIFHNGLLDRGIDFIQKPFTPVNLARKVREVLDG